MNNTNQIISQFVDDELAPTELDALLLSIKEQPELINKIARYQLTGAVLNNNQAVIIKTQFLDNISQKIEQEPHYLLPKRIVKKRSAARWQKSSLALAAVVSVVAVISLQPKNNDNPMAQTVAQQTQIQEKPVQIAKSKQTRQHERLKAYLQAHSDDLYTHGSLSTHPFARVASFRQD